MKRSLLYIPLLIVVSYLANFCYVNTGLYSEDIKKCGAELLITLDSAKTKNNALYFSESSDFSYSSKDSCQKSISTLLNDLCPGYRIASIAKGANHAGVYRQLISRISDNRTVKLIIVAVNLRSFGINWIESDLETNISRTRVLYSLMPPVVKKLCLTFKIYDNKEAFKRKDIIRWHYKHDKFTIPSGKFNNVRQWDKEVFNKGIADANGKKDDGQTALACHFIKNYAFVLSESNPRIKDLDDIVRYADTKGIKLLFNLLPENFEKAGRFFGEDLTALMHANVTFLKNRYGNKTLFIDNSTILGDSCFTDRDWPSEHYNFQGRNLVAKKMGEGLCQLRN